MMPSPKVIVIEDHLMVSQLLSAVIKDSMNLDLVAQATSVREGVEACLREKPDLVVLDWALPDGRGFEVLRTVAEDLSRTRWIMISSNEQEHMVREAIELGIHGFVLKRSDLSVFREAIHRVLAGETYYCARSAQLYVEAMRSEAQSVGSNLTGRERQVLRAFARGENLKVAADQLGVAQKTIANTMAALKDKLGIHEPAGLVRYAIKHGYVEEP